MYRILRLSNHPTIKKHGVGLHPFKISNSDEFETIFISPLPELGDNYIENTRHKLKISKVRFFKRPKNTSNKKLIIFHLKRIYTWMFSNRIQNYMTCKSHICYKNALSSFHMHHTFSYFNQ